LLKYPKHPITREAAWVLSPITMSLILASTMILLPPKLLPRPAKWLSLVTTTFYRRLRWWEEMIKNHDNWGGGVTWPRTGR
jgi:hypothetical protein